MLRNKKSQIIGQIFVYILVAVVIGGIVLTGYWAVSTILKKSCQVEQINFKTKLEGLLEKSNTFGSVARDTLTAPCDYTEVCFVDASKIGGTVSCSNQIVSGSVMDQKMNVFISSKKGTFPLTYSEYVTLNASNECLCIKSVNKKFYFTFNGLGPTTLVKAGSIGLNSGNGNQV